MSKSVRVDPIDMTMETSNCPYVLTNLPIDIFYFINNNKY